MRDKYDRIPEIVLKDRQPYTGIHFRKKFENTILKYLSDISIDVIAALSDKAFIPEMHVRAYMRDKTTISITLGKTKEKLEDIYKYLSVNFKEFTLTDSDIKCTPSVNIFKRGNTLFLKEVIEINTFQELSSLFINVETTLKKILNLGLSACPDTLPDISLNYRNSARYPRQVYGNRGSYISARFMPNVIFKGSLITETAEIIEDEEYNGFIIVDDHWISSPKLERFIDEINT